MEEPGELYWIHHYLQRGHSLGKLINLTRSERKFYIHSMNISREEEVKYDYRKIKDSLEALGVMLGGSRKRNGGGADS